jgi:hypothetical protein
MWAESYLRSQSHKSAAVFAVVPKIDSEQLQTPEDYCLKAYSHVPGTVRRELYVEREERADVAR